MSNLMAPRDAVTWLSENVRLDGISEIRWAMPNGEKKVTVQMSAGPTLLQRTWDLLDAKVNFIMDDSLNAAPEKERAKYEARGIADVLAMFMVPHFATSDDIVREAMRRYKAREAGDTEYETAGLGSRRYEPPAAVVMARADEARKPAKTKTRAPSTPRATGKKIPDAAIETSLKGIQSKMFTPAQIGSMYGMTAAEVKAQLGLA